MLELDTFLKGYFLIGLAILALSLAVQKSSDWNDFKRRAAHSHSLVSVFAILAAVILWELIWPVPVIWAVCRGFNRKAS